MKTMYRILILAVLIIGAISSYSYGSSTGLFAFIVLGFIFEGVFWFSVFPNKNKKH
ncbi:hypothetical protein SAMN02745724_04708 [Pseudoalteromonas denitrificans DSM 6059]|uniref:Uncharacterized protein n=1 Tax=Pseudoalteromonas denitrificans DSM 6059 TaxID=1123010 RepID=A0A1I1SVT2_9GAMM|nr:hypothetical protein SAMN02745724_04708 [Pseudoalteromonas denitrificans DSM 6059]